MSRRFGSGSRARRVLVRTLVAVLVVVVLVGLAAMTGIGMGLVVPWALARAAPEGWTVEVGSVEGAWNRRVRLGDLTMEGPDGVLEAEALLLEYRLLPLLERTIDVRTIHLVSPRFRGTLSAGEPPSDSADASNEGPNALDRLLSESPLGEWTLRIRDLRVEDARAVLESSAGTYRIEHADLAAATDLSPRATAITLDSLVVEGVPPSPTVADTVAEWDGEEASRKVSLRLSASLQDGELEVRTLDLGSARSHVTGAGNLLIAPVEGYLHDVDFALEAAPLDLRDLPMEIPAELAEDPLVRMQIRATGPPEAVTLALEIDGPGSFAARAEGLFRAQVDGSIAAADRSTLRLDGRLSVDLAEWTTSPWAGNVTADLGLTLGAREALATDSARVVPVVPFGVEGTLVHTPPSGAPGGLLGSPLRVDVDLARHSRVQPDADTVLTAIDATATVYRPPAHASRTVGAPAVPATAPIPAEADWVEIGVLSAQTEGSGSRWQVDLLLDSGSVEGTGEVSWADAARELVVETLRVRRLDLSLVSADMPTTSIDGSLAGRLTGSSVTDVSGHLTLGLDSSTVGESAIDSAAVIAELDEGSITGSASIEADAGDVRMEYHIVVGDSLLEAEVDRFAAVGPLPLDSTRADDAREPAVVANAEPADTAVEVERVPTWKGFGRATATWARGDTRRGTLVATLDSARAGTLRVLGGTVEGALFGDSVTVSARAELGGVLSAPAAVHVTAAGRGTSPSDATGLLELRAARFHLQEEDSTARSGAADSLSLRVSAVEPGIFALDGHLRPGEGGLVNLSGSATAVDRTLSFTFDALGTLENPTQLLSGGSIQRVSLESSGARSADGWRELSAALLLTDGLWRGMEADTLLTNLHYDSTGLVLDTLSLDSNVLTVDGGGSLPTAEGDAGKIALTAHFDLEPLRGQTETELPTIGGNELDATISGTTDSVQVSLTSSMTALVHRQIRVSGFEAEASALLRAPFVDLGGLVSGRARVLLERVSLPDAEIGNLTVTTEGTPDDLRMEASAVVDEARGGELTATIDPTPDGRTMELDRLHLQLDQDEWELLQPAVLEFRDGLALRGFELRAGEQAISIDGGITSAGVLDLELAMDSTDVSTVADLAGFPRLAGWLGGRASLSGTRDAPVGTVDFTFGFHETDEEPTSARITLESDGRLVDTDVTVLGPDGGSLTVAGLAPIAEGESVDLAVDAQRFSVAPAVVFVDGELLSDLEGRIDARLAVSGPRNDLGFDGPFTLEGGLMDLPPLGLTWDGIRLVAHGEGRELVIDSARVESGSGSMGIGGSVAFADEITLDLLAGFDDFQAIRTNAYQASISGDLRATGTPLAPVVEGEVTTESLDVYIDERPSDGGLEDVELTAADLEILRERFGYVVVEDDTRPQTSELLTADVTVEFGRDSWIRSRSTPEMAVGFAGEVDVQIRPGEEPQLQGTLTTVPERGYIAQFGKRFEPREGTVTLDGPPADAVLDLSATYTVPSYANPDGAEATIVLGVTGTQEDLSLTLSSEPPMENADIVSYIATGRPAASTFALGDANEETAPEETDPPGGGLAETGAGIAVGQILSSIETAAQTGVGLDVVEIQNDGIRGATLVAGKYLSPRLYVGFAQPIRAASEIEIEFQALRNLLLNMEGSASSLSFFLRGRVVY